MKNLVIKNKEMTFDKNRSLLHQKDLNMEVPKDFFLSSKKEILSKTIHQRKKSKVIIMSKFYRFSAAIAILICLGSTISFYNSISSKEVLLKNDVDNELLLSALFENDNTLEALTTSYMLDDLQTTNEKIN